MNHSMASAVPVNRENNNDYKSPQIKQEPIYKASTLPEKKVPFLYDLIKWETQSDCKGNVLKEEQDGEKAVLFPVIESEETPPISREECYLFPQLPYPKLSARDLDLTEDRLKNVSKLRNEYPGLDNTQTKYKIVVQEMDCGSRFDPVNVDCGSQFDFVHVGTNHKFDSVNVEASSQFDSVVGHGGRFDLNSVDSGSQFDSIVGHGGQLDFDSVDCSSQFDSVIMGASSHLDAVRVDACSKDRNCDFETHRQVKDNCNESVISKKAKVTDVSQLATDRVSSRGDKTDNGNKCNESYGSVNHLKENKNELGVNGASCSSKSSMLTYKRIHTAVKTYKCDDCGAEFGTLRFLKRHLENHVRDKMHKQTVCRGTFFSKTFPIKHNIAHTGTRIRTRKQRAHTKNIHERVPTTLPKPESLEIMEKTVKDRAGICEVCGAVFSFTCNILRHRKLHNKEKPFKCDLCGLALATSYSLQEHRRTHTGEKPFTCNICDAAFSCKGNMLRHQRVHTHEKPHLCDVCGAGFAWPWHLTEHKRSHTGEKPFVCNYCDARFALQGHLKKHVVVHTGERNYTCDDCGKKFARQTNLHSHRRKHEKNKRLSSINQKLSQTS